MNHNDTEILHGGQNLVKKLPSCNPQKTGVFNVGEWFYNCGTIILRLTAHRFRSSDSCTGENSTRVGERIMNLIDDQQHGQQPCACTPSSAAPATMGGV